MRAYTRIPRVRIFDAPLSIHWSVFVIAGVLLLNGIEKPLIAAITIAAYLAVILLHETGHAWFAKQDYMVAWGGVMAQLAVALPLVVLDLIFDIGQVYPLGPVVGLLGYVSIGIAAFNLLPVADLDGAKAWRLFPLLLEERRERTFRPSRKSGRMRLFK